MIIHLGMNKTGGTYLRKEVYSKMKQEIVMKGMLAGNPIRKTSISDEVFIREMIAYGIFMKYGSKTKIILGVREKNDWLNSCYNQYVKGMSKGYLSFDKWKKLYFDDGLLDNERYITLLKSLFDNVFIYYFYQLKNDKDNLIRRLCEYCNNEMIVYNDVIVNKKLNPMQLFLYRLINYMSDGLKYILK